MRSQSIWISAGNTTVTGLKSASQEASDNVEDVGIHQDSSESDANESK